MSEAILCREMVEVVGSIGRTAQAVESWRQDTDNHVAVRGYAQILRLQALHLANVAEQIEGSPNPLIQAALQDWFKCYCGPATGPEREAATERLFAAMCESERRTATALAGT